MAMEVGARLHGIHRRLDGRVAIQGSRCPVMGMAKAFPPQDHEGRLPGPVDPDLHVVLIVVGRSRSYSDERHQIRDGALDSGGLNLPTLEVRITVLAMPADYGREGH